MINNRRPLKTDEWNIYRILKEINIILKYTGYFTLNKLMK